MKFKEGKNMRKIYRNNKFYDSENDVFIDSATGEAELAQHVIAPESAKIKVLSDDQLTAYQQKQQKRSKEAFYFVNTEVDLSNIAGANLTRLIFLNSYRNFNNDFLMLTERKKMTTDDLPQLLKISKKSVDRLLAEISPKYLEINADKTISLNSEMFFKGRIHKREWARVFSNGIRELYNSCYDNAKAIGYIFEMLPYINYQYNLLCWNPSETDPNKIKKMTITEFCDNIGYGRKNYKKLIAQYNDIVFNVDGTRQKFCSYSNDGINIKDSHVLVNPNVVFSGNDKEDIRIFGNFNV